MDFSSMVLGMYVDPEQRREDDERIIALAVEQSVLAGELGFNPWYTHHHFRGPWHSAPMQFAAYVAPQLPDDVYLGFGVLSIPYFHPVRLVEQMNLLHQLTKGRVLFGLGSGFPGIEPLSAGLDEEYHRSGKAARDTLEVMDHVWDFENGDEPYEFEIEMHRGKIVQRVMPAPYGGRRPTIIRTSRRDEAVAEAARRGWPTFLGSFGADLVGQAASYRRDVQAAGHPPEVVEECLRWSTVDWLSVLVADTDAEAQELFEHARAERMEIREAFMERAGAIFGPAMVSGALGPGAADFAAGRDMAEAIVGSPDTVAAEVQKIADLGINHLLLRFVGEWTGRTRPIIEGSMRTFSEHVAPRFESVGAEMLAGRRAD